MVAPSLPEARTALKRLFGFDDFRGRQTDVLGRVLAGQSTLAVMPTGAGKSLTYQLPAVLLEGTCVVVSPLIALMHDQLRSARANGSERKIIAAIHFYFIRLER
jgi:ATP-dependent DNA helicase RecQ